ncbi:phycobilisome rod-core linker polypeptide [Synechococcus sp. SYN20]|uniref:phycobilisome rod-core linker polypeptide n=1 Tax=Synechococcus sp. SYN20 TaxID=1050714 RepID=UPI0016444E91
MENDREEYLESQLRNNSITVRDFIRGLILSDRFRRGNKDCNNNYRLAEQVVARALRRKAYNEEEGQTSSIIIAEKGFNYFIDYILNSNE